MSLCLKGSVVEKKVSVAVPMCSFIIPISQMGSVLFITEVFYKCILTHNKFLTIFSVDIFCFLPSLLFFCLVDKLYSC